MSHDPQNPYGANYAPPPAPTSNGVGIAGLIVSVIGLVTCGILSPIGLIISLFGLARRPRGEAIAGTILGGLGTVAILGFVVFMVSTVAVVGAGAKIAFDAIQTQQKLKEAELAVEMYQGEHGELPDGIEGNKLILDKTDAWGNTLRYELEDDDYQIRSAGPDGEFDTDDDILNTDSNFDSDTDVDFGGDFDGDVNIQWNDDAAEPVVQPVEETR